MPVDRSQTLEDLTFHCTLSCMVDIKGQGTVESFKHGS